MKGSKNSRRKKLSAGSTFMLIMLAAVLCSSALILGKLSSGASVDLSKLHMNVLDIEDNHRSGTDETEETFQEEEPKAETRVTLVPAAVKETPVPPMKDGFTLTMGGGISLSGEVRKNSRSTDAKVADYSDIMMLLAPEINSDANAVFLENILSDQHKAGDAVAPGNAVVLLKEAGFDTAACGFSQAYTAGRDGIEATLKTLDGEGIQAIGIQTGNSSNPEIRTINGVRVSFLQYTDTIPDKTRKSMKKDGTADMIPEADPARIAEDIETVRERGAEAVVVMISWGKNGKDPDKSQRELARRIASAGADLIVGNGSHVPQTAEYVSGDDGRKVLCVWSLGSLLSGDRSNIKRLSGYLFHVTIRKNTNGDVLVQDPEYTPVYTWKYKQDGRFYYRCVAAGEDTPDGMDSEQRKNMDRAAENVRNVLKDSPLKERGNANAD